MRKNLKDQLPLNPAWSTHELAKELREISRILDQHPDASQWIMQDLSDGASPKRGASGLSGEQALRCALLKNWHGLSYRKLAFHLQDSVSFQAFCRIPFNWRPSKACLQENISRIRPKTWARIRRALVRWAGREGLETGRKVRGDSTAVASPVHHPTDSGLLCDSVRVVTRLLRKLSQAAPVLYSDHCRRAKRRHLGIGKKRGKNRLKLYKDLLKVARRTEGYASRALEQTPVNEKTAPLLGQLQHHAELMRRVIAQTERRVLQGDSVPAQEKVVSIFEEHTDIIKKGQREPTYGHKVFLSAGKSSLILDCYVKRGNPADETQFQPMLENIEKVYGRMPRQVSFDAGFTSGANLEWAKEDKKIQDVAFPRKGRMKVSEMVRSSWVYKQLKKFRAGIEGCISMLKRVFGADRCTWKGWEHFCQYVQLSVVSFNLLVLARLRLA